MAKAASDAAHGIDRPAKHRPFRSAQTIRSARMKPRTTRPQRRSGCKLRIDLMEQRTNLKTKLASLLFHSRLVHQCPPRTHSQHPNRPKIIPKYGRNSLRQWWDGRATRNFYCAQVKTAEAKLQTFSEFPRYDYPLQSHLPSVWQRRPTKRASQEFL